jgi:hypothetical protein
MSTDTLREWRVGGSEEREVTLSVDKETGLLTLNALDQISGALLFSSVDDLLTVRGRSGPSKMPFSIGISMAKNLVVEPLDISFLETARNTGNGGIQLLCQAVLEEPLSPGSPTAVEGVRVTGTGFHSNFDSSSFLSLILSLEILVPRSKGLCELFMRGTLEFQTTGGAINHTIPSTKIFIDRIDLIRVDIQFLKEGAQKSFNYDDDSVPHGQKTQIVKRSFFVNGYNAWSFCGAVPLGGLTPSPALPDVFARAFHDGSGALGVNQRSTSTARDGRTWAVSRAVNKAINWTTSWFTSLEVISVLYYENVSPYLRL